MRRLEARIKKLERGLPQPGAPTMDVPGPWPGTVRISTHGQVSVQRLANGKLPNRRNWASNPFEKVAEFGVVGSFVLTPEAEVGGAARLESEVTPEVEVLVDGDPSPFDD